MMTKEEFLYKICINIYILKKNKITFTERELNELMDSEMEKSPEEMDTDLIDFCLDVLNGKYGEGYYREV